MGCPRGTRSGISVRFSCKKRTSLFISREKVIIIISKHGTTTSFFHYNLFLGKLTEKSARKARVNTERVYWIELMPPWASHNVPTSCHTKTQLLWKSKRQSFHLNTCTWSISPNTSKTRFRRRTFHEPNLIHWITYMESSISELIRNASFNLERLSRSFRQARTGISPLERLWNGFDSDAELFTYRT